MLAQNFDNWIEGAIILLIVVISALGSAGKWIVQQIEIKRQKDALRRSGTYIDDTVPSTMNRKRSPTRTDEMERSGLPPIAVPIPPVMRPAHRPASQTPPPVMERVMEILLEKTTGTTMERRVREIAERVQRPAPPPPPAQTSEPRVRRQSAKLVTQPPKPGRPMTVAEREARREQTRQTEVERETQRLIEREQQFTDDTDQRLGSVGTHIQSAEIRDPSSMDAFALGLTLDDPEAVRRAFVLSEILAPPLALRKGAVDSYN